MIHLTNKYDPRRADAREALILVGEETRAEAWQLHQQWLGDKIIGRPKATKDHTIQELESMGIVGIYMLDTEAPDVV